MFAFSDQRFALVVVFFGPLCTVVRNMKIEVTNTAKNSGYRYATFDCIWWFYRNHAFGYGWLFAAYVVE